MSWRVSIGAAGLLLGTVYGAAVWADARLVAPPPTPIVTDRHGAFLTQAGHVRGGRHTYGYWTTPPPQHVVAATLALEDRRFWSHPGVDGAAVLRSAWSRLHGGRSGASTLAMQVVRMQHPRPRTLWAKAVEAGAAVAITARHGREAVLAHYMRLAPYGNGSHGIGHAARWHFDKPAADLSVAEAALLAAVPQAPALANLHRPGGLARAKARAARALAAMNLPAGERDGAQAALAALRPVPAPQRPADAMHAALRLARLAVAARDAGQVDGADPRVSATLDLRRQAAVAARARADLAAWHARGAEQVAVMVVRRRTGEVLADIGSAGWRTRPAGAVDFSAASRSPGSTLKPFLYGLALDRGLIAPDSVLADVPEGSGGVANSDNAFLGLMLPRQALANSRNVPATNLLARIGLPRAFGYLRDAGLHGLDGPAERFGLSMAIGALPTSLDRLVQAYGALANDGVVADLRWLRGGEGGSTRRILSADAARLVAAFLSDPLARLPSFPRYGPTEYPFAVALKTGTSQGYRDAWTVAWSDEYIVGAWVGRPDAAPMQGLSGARTAARLVQGVLLDLHGAGRADLQAGGFTAPRGRAAIEVCTGTGQPGPCQGQGQLTEWLRPGAPPAPAPASRLAIVQPAPDQHVWRNPEAPPAFNRLVLRATATPPVPQVVWVVNGQAVAVASPDKPFHWPMVPGRHQFQVRLPLQNTVSAPVRIVVE